MREDEIKERSHVTMVVTHNKVLDYRCSYCGGQIPANMEFVVCRSRSAWSWRMHRYCATKFAWGLEAIAQEPPPSE